MSVPGFSESNEQIAGSDKAFVVVRMNDGSILECSCDPDKPLNAAFQLVSDNDYTWHNVVEWSVMVSDPYDHTPPEQYKCNGLF